MKCPELSVVIPSFNEEHNIDRGVLESINVFLSKQKFTYEVLFIDDGSSDRTKDKIKEWIRGKNEYRLINNPHQGKALTVVDGMKIASGTYCLFCDFDQATPISEITKLLEYAKRGYDVVIGSRKNERIGAPTSRKIMAKGFMFLRTIILGVEITDTQCGFKLFSNKAKKDLFNSLKLYSKHSKVQGSRVTAGFDVELLYLAKKKGYQIKEIPVLWNYVETRRVNPIRDSIEGFQDLIKIRLNSLRGFYG
jgi:glycosyltransferase involved in cell wall biosynthesis